MRSEVSEEFSLERGAVGDGEGEGGDEDEGEHQDAEWANCELLDDEVVRHALSSSLGKRQKEMNQRMYLLSLLKAELKGRKAGREGVWTERHGLMARDNREDKDSIWRQRERRGSGEEEEEDKGRKRKRKIPSSSFLLAGIREGRRERIVKG